MKANTLEGKRESVHTDFIMHSLGLGVCADTLVSMLHNCKSSFACIQVMPGVSRAANIKPSSMHMDLEWMLTAYIHVCLHGPMALLPVLAYRGRQQVIG